MSSPNGSISAHQQRSSLNGIQRDHGLSSHHSGEDTEIDMNGQDGMELERDDREVRDETRQHKLALGGGNRHREGDIGLGISNHLDSDDLPSPYLRTQFPSHSHRSHYTPSQTDTARMKDTPSSRPIASPIKSGRSSSPAHSIPPASPLQAHIAPAAAAPPSKPRYAQAAPNHDSPRRPYNAYTPGQSSSLPIANIATTNGAQAGSRVVREDRAGEVLPTRKELGSLWKRDIPAEPSLEEAGLGEDVEMKEDKEDMELDELESETDKGNIVPAVASAAAVPKPRSARASRNRKPGKNAAGKKDKDKAKTKDVQEDKENLDVRLGDKESKGEFAYEYVAVTQRKEGRKNIRYEMSMRQQPVQARMCGAGEKSDRRPIDPPPIVQLKVFDMDGEDMGVEKGKKGKKGKKGPGGMSFMHNPYYFLYATLIGSDDAQTELHVIDDGKTRFLTGTPVSSLYYLKDLNSRDAAFFVFPDLGVRKEGRYKLKLTLFEIVDQEVFYCATSYTDTFTVLSAKKFPGMQRATDLSRTFAEQGLKIRVRKEVKKRSSATPTRNKRRSSIEQDDSYYASLQKRPRPSLDPSYASSPYPSGYYPHTHTMPPPPIPRHSQPTVHPPTPYYGSQSGRPSTLPPPAEHHRPRNPSEGYDLYPPPLSVKQESPTRPRQDGYPPRERYEQTEQDRRRQWEIQMEQRREIDSKREAEARRVAEAKGRERSWSPKKASNGHYPPPGQYGYPPQYSGYPHQRAETYPPGTYGHPSYPPPHYPSSMSASYDSRAVEGGSSRDRPRDSRASQHQAGLPRSDHPSSLYPTYAHSPHHGPPPLQTNLSSTSRSTPQPLRTPQDPSPTLPPPLSRSNSNHRSPMDHYEPSNRLLPSMRTDDSGIITTPRKDDREIKRLPSISSFTPGQSRSGTPGTPATSASTTTGGRDHRMGLGHLVD